MHPHGVAAVVVNYIRGDPLAKVGLEAVYTLFHQPVQFALVPCYSFRIGKVHHTKTGLPAIPLPYITVGAHKQVTIVCCLVEKGRLLADVRVDPNADFQPLVVHPLEHSFHIRELALIPFKAAPFAFLHPETIEVEYAQGNIALVHAVNETCDGLFVVIRSEGGAEPKTEGPGRGQRRPSCQGSVTAENTLSVRGTDDDKVQTLSRHAELHLGDGFGTDFKGNGTGFVNQNTVVIAA